MAERAMKKSCDNCAGICCTGMTFKVIDWKSIKATMSKLGLPLSAGVFDVDYSLLQRHMEVETMTIGTSICCLLTNDGRCSKHYRNKSRLCRTYHCGFRYWRDRKTYFNTPEGRVLMQRIGKQNDRKDTNS